MQSDIDLSISKLSDYLDPLLIYNPDSLEIIKGNQKAAEIFGFSLTELKGLTIRELQFPQGDHELYHQLKDITPKDKPSDLGTFNYRTRDCENITLKADVRRLNLNGESLCILHFLQKGREKNRSEDKIETHKSRTYRNQQEQLYNNPLAMVRFDADFTIVEWSDRSEEKTGYKRKEVLGKSAFEFGLFDESEIPKVKKHFNALKNSKTRDRFETLIQLKGGELMHALLHVSAHHNENGDLDSILAFIQNIDVRKQYIKHLEDRQKKYHQLFEHASDAIALLDGDTIVDCNSLLTGLLDLQEKEKIIGQSILKFSFDEDLQNNIQSNLFNSAIKKAKAGKPQIFDWNFISSSGQEKFVEISLRKLALEDGDYVEAVIRDLTEREKARSQLKKEQKRLKNAQKLADIGWWHYHLEKDELSLSNVLYDILDIDEEQFGSDLESFKQIVHIDDQPKIGNIIERVKSEAGPTDYFLRIHRSDSDDIMYTHGRATTKFDRHNNPVALSGVLQDITRYREAQNELNRQKELFESLFLDSPVAIAMINTDGKIRKVNDSFEDLFGYTEKELMGEDLLEFQLPEDRKDKIDEFYEYLFQGTPSLQYIQDRRLTKHGDEKHLIIASVPVTVNGEPIAAFDIYTDITKLRKTEEELQKSLEEKEVLLSEIHHRVKNNLAIISGLLELEAMDWEEGTTIHNVLTESKLRIHSMASIHEQLYESKDFSNISIGRYISDLVDSISQTFEKDEKHIEINVSTDDILLNINQALPCALIINELVTHTYENTIKGETEESLDITFEKDEDTIKLTLDDGGPGLPDDFEIMVQKSLGHRLVQQLVKQLDGDIEVNNHDGGTRYIITFQRDNKDGSAGNHIIREK